MNKQRQQELILQMLLERPATAHDIIFKHRHPSASPEYHKTMIGDYYSAHPRVLHLVFRGGSKSTIAEEAMALSICLKLIRNGVVFGVSETRAKERLQAIKHEIEYNEALLEIFGDQVGNTWSETKIVLKNGMCLQALGRDQSLRGAKHLDARPEFALFDDIEDSSSVATPESRAKLMKHVTSTILPGLTPAGTNRVRMAATPLDHDALAVNFAKMPNWLTRKYPIKVIDHEASVREGTKIYKAVWPERFPLREINITEMEFKQAGDASGFAREFMLEVVAEEDIQFKAEYIKIEPVRRSFHSTFAVYDPARTTNEMTSAHTGKVVFSWINNRLILWETGGYFWKPDEIIDDIFRTDEIYNPIVTGVEEDGLHEFIMQPLRAQQVTRGRPIPIRALKAPKGKHGFIRGLQPFFKAGEVILAQDITTHMTVDEARAAHQTFIDQLLTFPTGRIDVPNAAAYALIMRPGLPVFDNFGQEHVKVVNHKPFHPTFLAVNSTNTQTTLQVVQVYGGQLYVLNDWVADGDAGTVLRDLMQQAALALPASTPLTQGQLLANTQTSRALLGSSKAFAPPSHFSKYDAIGLRAAAAHVPMMLYEGGALERGREELRAMLGRTTHGQPAVTVDPGATWTLRAFSGGFSREIGKDGRVREEPTENIYSVLMGGLCALVGNAVHTSNVDSERNYAQSASGHRYLTSRPVR